MQSEWKRCLKPWIFKSANVFTIRLGKEVAASSEQQQIWLGKVIADRAAARFFKRFEESLFCKKLTVNIRGVLFKFLLQKTPSGLFFL